MLRAYILYLSILFAIVRGSLSCPLEIVWSGIEKSVISPDEVVTARYVISNPDSVSAKALALLESIGIRDIDGDGILENETTGEEISLVVTATEAPTVRAICLLYTSPSPRD